MVRLIDENKLIESVKAYKELGLGRNLHLIADTIIEIIEGQPKVGEWIPVEERLPENDKDVLVTCNNGEVAYGFYSKEDDYWFMDSIDNEAYLVLAWQPLPEPYEVKEND